MDESIKIDMSSFNKFSRELKKAEPQVHKALLKGLKDAGDIVAIQARANASWSKRIPQTVKVRRSGATIRIVAGVGMKPPHAKEARAFEHRGLPGTFRHPVYGNREKWVSQQARPFLRPALLSHRDVALREAKRALDRTFQQIGFH